MPLLFSKAKQIGLASLCYTLVAPIPLLAANSSPISGSLADNTSLFWAICKVAGSLSLVVGLMVLLIYFIKKSGIAHGVSTQGSLIKIMETKMVAPKKYITIVEIAGKCVALGVTDQNINMLTDLEDTIKDQIEVPVSDKPTPSFAKLLKSIKVSMKKNADAGANNAS